MCAARETREVELVESHKRRGGPEVGFWDISTGLRRYLLIARYRCKTQEAWQDDHAAGNFRQSLVRNTAILLPCTLSHSLLRQQGLPRDGSKFVDNLVDWKRLTEVISLDFITMMCPQE